MPGFVITRQVEADPASLALLLAGPTAVDLWPGAVRIGEFGDRMSVQADLPDGLPVEVALQATAPRRTPTSFVVRFEFTGEGVPRTSGTITLTGQGPAATKVDMELSWAGGIDRLLRDDMTSKAGSFLETLATTARERACAA